MKRRRFASPDLQRTYDRLVGASPRRALAYEADFADAEVGMMVRDLRLKVGLTQAQLAGRIGTTATAISRLESADYAGHSLAMLRRVAGAVGMKVAIRFVPGDRDARSTRLPGRQAARKRAAPAKASRPRRTA